MHIFPYIGNQIKLSVETTLLNHYTVKYITSSTTQMVQYGRVYSLPDDDELQKIY